MIYATVRGRAVDGESERAVGVRPNILIPQGGNRYIEIALTSALAHEAVVDNEAELHRARRSWMDGQLVPRSTVNGRKLIDVVGVVDAPTGTRHGVTQPLAGSGKSPDNLRMRRITIDGIQDRCKSKLPDGAINAGLRFVARGHRARQEQTL